MNEAAQKMVFAFLDCTDDGAIYIDGKRTEETKYGSHDILPSDALLARLEANYEVFFVVCDEDWWNGDMLDKFGDYMPEDLADIVRAEKDEEEDAILERGYEERHIYPRS